MAAAAIDVVVLEERRRRQHDVGHLRRLGHELLVHAGEQIVAGKAVLDLVLIGRNRHRVGVLDDHRRDRRAAVQRLAVAGQDRADARLIEHAHRAIPDIEPFDHRLVELKMSALMWKAPPPSSCQAPVTAGMQDAACMLAAPLREREKP